MDLGFNARSLLVPGAVAVESLILFVLGVYVFFIGVVVMIAGIVRALRPIRAPQEFALPAGLIIERKRRGMIDDDNESMSYMTLEIPKGSAGVWQFLGIFIAVWPMPAVVWIAINGSFSLWWPSLMVLGVPVVIEFVSARSHRAMSICVGHDAVLISEKCWGGFGGGVLIPIRTAEVLCAADGCFEAKYWPEEGQDPGFYVRNTQGGLPRGTYPWLAALLRLLKSRHGKKMSASPETPVWSTFGFKNQADLIAAVKDVSC